LAREHQTPEITEKPAGELTAAQADAFHVEVLGEQRAPATGEGPFRAFGRAALAGEELVGLMAGDLAPRNDDAGEWLLNLRGGVHPRLRRRGIGRRLVESVVADCRALERPVEILATLTEAEVDAGRPFLSALGFDEAVGLVRYQADPLIVPLLPPDARHPTRAYRGGEPATDAAITDVYARAYRGRRNVPQLRLGSSPDLLYLLVFDGDRLVGHTTAQKVNDVCFIDSIVVARSHWASGAADALCGAIHRHALEQAARIVVAYVETTNRPSRALVERNGLTQAAVFSRFSRTVTKG